MPITIIGEALEERALKKITKKAAKPIEMVGPTPTGEALTRLPTREEQVTKQARMMREKGFGEEAAQVEMQEALYQKATANAQAAELDFNIAQGYANMDGMRAGLQMIQAGAVEEGQAYMNRFLPPEQQVQRITPTPGGNFIVEVPGQAPEEVSIDDMIPALVDAKTQFLAQQQMLKLRMEQKESARRRGADDTPNKILARALNKRLLGEQVALQEGHDTEEDLYKSYPELRLLPTEEELIQKHEMGDMVGIAMGIFRDNPEMLEMYRSADPSEFAITLMTEMRKRLKEEVKVPLRKGARPREALPEGLTEERLRAVMAREEAAGRKADREFLIEQYTKRRR